VTTESTPDAPASDADAPPRWAWLVALAMVPYLVAAATAVFSTWAPASDEAVFLARALDAPTDLPLVGVHSRFGWYHPGPVLHWWFSGPLWVSGGATVVALLAAIALKACAAAGAVWLAGRQAGFVGAALATGTATLLMFTQPDGPFAVWNPTIVIVVLFCCLVACWAVANGDVWGVPVLAAAGSVCIQAHVGYAPVVLLAAATAALPVAWRTLRNHRRSLRPSRSSITALAAAAAILVILWAPVIWDQVGGSGNLGAVGSFLAGNDDPPVGAGSALGLLARAYLPSGPWAGGPDPTLVWGDALAMPAWWLVVPATALGWSAWSAQRRGDRAALRLALIAGVAAAGATLALAAIRDTPFPYLFSWSRSVSGFIWFTVALATWRAVTATDRASPAALRKAAGAIALILVVVGSVRIPSIEPPRAMSSEMVRSLTPAALEAAPAGSTVAMVITLSEAFSGVADGVLYELDRNDRTVVVPGEPGRGPAWSFRSGDATDVDVVLAVVVGATIAEWDSDPVWEAIARYEPLDPTQMAELVTLRNETDPTDATVERIRALNAIGEPAVLYRATDPALTGGY